MLDSLMSGMTGGAPSFKSSSNADGLASQGPLSFGFDNSGMTTATGGSKAGSVVPWYVIAGIAVLSLLALKKLK